MACLKIGSKSDGFQRKGQAWFCTTGLQSDVVIQVSEMSFHLHKFPLVTRSGRLAHLIKESLEQGEGGSLPRIDVSEIPGGPDAFELAAKFCYGVKLELTAANVVALRCAGEYLEMTEEFGEGNLIAQADGFLSQIVLKHWKECIQALSSCGIVSAEAEELGIVRSCVEAVALMACTDPSLSLGWPMPNASAQSPGGSLLWNGISTGARPKRPRGDWWYEDVASLSLPLYSRVIGAMQKRGVRAKSIAGALMHFARRHLPGLHNRQAMAEGSGGGSRSLPSIPSEHDQKAVLEAIASLLPLQRSAVPTKFLSGLLRSAVILSASRECRSNIEWRIGAQLEQASLEDLLLPNLAHNQETLYDMDCVQRILDHFARRDQPPPPIAPPLDDDHALGSSPSLAPWVMVGNLIDDYLAEVAPDVNVKPSKFQSLAEFLPDAARVSEDRLYRAVDIYLKAHPWLGEAERERLCRVMDCQKLSLEACAHAAQNERLPLRTIVEVLFFEQLKLRTAIASSFMAADSSQPLDEAERTDRSLRGDVWASAMRDNQALKMDMDRMKARVNDLEQQCSGMREELSKLSKGRGLGGMIKSHICKTKGNDVQDQSLPSGGNGNGNGNGNGDARAHHPPRNTRHHRSSTLLPRSSSR